MMRAVILLLIILILAVIAGLMTGFIDIQQVRQAKAPQLSTTHNGVVAKGGQAPAFDVETGSVTVGAKPTTVKTPTLKVQRPSHETGSPANTQ